MAALLAATGAATATHLLTPPPSRLVPVVVAARDLPAGRTIGTADLETTGFWPASVPRGVLSRDRASGARLAAPLRRGQPLTDAAVLGPGALAGTPAGTVAATVHLDSDPALLAPGRRVTVIAADDGPGAGPPEALGRVLASGVVVLSVTRPAGDGPALAGDGSGRGAQVVLAVSVDQARRLWAGEAGRLGAVVLR